VEQASFAAVAVLWPKGLSWFVRHVKGRWETEFGVALVGAWLSMGCALQNVESAFAADFDCPDAKAEETGSHDRYRVAGCGRAATYVCIGGGSCTLQTVREEPERDVARNTPAGEASSEIKVESKGKEASMLLELPLERRALLRLTAVPTKRADFVQLKLIHKDEATANCALEWMINGQLTSPPKAIVRRADGAEHRIQIGRGLIAEFRTAQKVVLRVCNERLPLTSEQVQNVREFMERFEEEVAWSSPARDGSTAGMLAPSGGWPSWDAPSAPLPAPAHGPALAATTLFKKLSVSVFQVEAKRVDGNAQGSAVAVSPTELLTNCHVLQGALEVNIRQGKQRWHASVVRADPPSDRCTITATDKKFEPVAGVRPYASVEVGEAAYTLGSPVGLELTLSNGIVSGRREEGGRSYVQTTAPISPGSSGGGLFDASGNLIGITTMVLAGRERLNQSLNFAIPADAFGQP
jgi:Trypsin-like peptidase domain